MNSFILFFISGFAYFAGLILIITGIGWSFLDKINFFKISSRTLIIFGIILVFASGASVSVFFLIFLTALLAVFFVLMKKKPKSRLPFLTCLKAVIILSCLYCLYEELFHLHLPVLKSSSKFNKMFVIGDSLSAGIGFKEEKTWPDILKKEHGVKLKTFVQGGATIANAVEKADLIKDNDAVIIIEIGGNDILRGTEQKSFENDLELLFKKLSGKNHTIIMFELPLPPLKGEYGRIQRQIAAKYGIYLIPKRFLAFNLSKENTCDGLHLSNQGHRKMSEIIWTIVGPSFEK